MGHAQEFERQINLAGEIMREDRHVLRALAEMSEPRTIMNEINVIAPYKYMGLWVFDDPRAGLVQEPFVGGADTMIDSIVADIPNAAQGFAMVFSEAAFPGHQYRLEWRRADGTGNWYYSRDLDSEGWLCPALLRYFATAPKEIYVQVKPH
jgi:hypothetical protein